MNINNTDNKKVISKIEQELENNQLPYVGDIMDLITTYYSNRQILNTFYTGDLIDFLEDTWDFEEYICDKKSEAIENYIRFHPEYTKEDFMKEIQTYNKSDFKNFLCDLTSNGFFVKTEDLLNDIKKMIGNQLPLPKGRGFDE